MKRSQENFTHAHDDYEAGQKRKAGDLRAEGDSKEKPARMMKRNQMLAMNLKTSGELPTTKRADLSPGPSRNRKSIMV